MNLTQKIVEALQDRNSAEVARRTGLHPNTVRLIKSGKKAPALHTAEVLAKYLGVTL